MTDSGSAGPPPDAVTCLAVVLLVLGAAVPVAAAPDTVAESHDAFSVIQVDADSVSLTVELRDDGSADWRVEYRVRLDDQNATEAFEALQADVEANESAYISRFEERMGATVRDAESMTGREMALRNVRVSTTTEQLPQTYGVLAYTFEWTHFAAVDDGQLRAGDALVGLFLDAETTLLVAWPDGYAVVDVSPSPDERRDNGVVWRGPVDFGPGEPRLVLEPTGGSGDGDTSLLGVAVVGLILVGGTAFVWRRRRTRRGAAATIAGTGSVETDARADDTATNPAEQLLSNEERVIELVKANGGRIKQQEIVEQLDWTDAKTSQVVGKLRDSGELEGFRLGRENVLRLPEADDSRSKDGPSSVDDGR